MRPGTTTALQAETRSKEEDMPPKDRSPLLPGKAFSDDLRAKDSAPREAVGPCVGARDLRATLHFGESGVTLPCKKPAILTPCTDRWSTVREDLCSRHWCMPQESLEV
ncbi:UNVERIFIED_CONTAM: hypothetical protein K2H54_006673 [Gekko kuhli]